MKQRIALNHVTHYRYSHPTWLGPQTVRLKPGPNSKTPVTDYHLLVEPEPAHVNWHLDPLGNPQARLVINGLVSEFKLTVAFEVELQAHNPFDFFLDPEVEHFPFMYEPILAESLAPYLVTEPLTPMLRDYLIRLDRSPARTVDFIVRTNRQVFHDVEYTVRYEPGVQSPDVTLLRQLGSCRDSAWLLVQVFRHCGIAARFTSGYLIQLTAHGDDGRIPDNQRTHPPVSHDQGELHAWCEVYLPGAGWIGLDATSGLLTGEGHIPLASTAHPAAAAPVTGDIGPCEARMDYSHTVRHL